MDETDDEEALLAKAIAMSMAAGGAGDADGDAPMTPAKTGAGASKDDQDIADVSCCAAWSFHGALQLMLSPLWFAGSEGPVVHLAAH
jgi:hypothetical protein